MMKKQNKKNIWREENKDKTTTTETIDNTLPMNLTTSTLMKLTHGKNTEVDNKNNIKPKIKPHTKTLNQNKITGNNNIQ